MSRTTMFRRLVVVFSSIATITGAGILVSPLSASAEPVPSLPGLPFVLPDLGEVPTLPEILDQIVPPPELPPVTEPVPPVAALSPQDKASGLEDIQALRTAMMPKDIGEPFFDHYPDNLPGLANGQVIEERDVTATAALFVGAPTSRVVQFKFRSNDASDQPSFGTATLVIPAAAWSGPGDRPVVVNNLPINGLGRHCTPGYTMAHGLSPSTGVTDYVPPVTALAVARGYAVLIPDHEGPRMAYAVPQVAGHVILDSIRAMTQLFPELGESNIGMQGYSGGAIATNGAAKLIDSYAPELKSRIVGVAIGGTPVDEAVLTQSMNGTVNAAKGVAVAAGIGNAREFPEILTQIGNPARQIGPFIKDQCIVASAMLGLLPIDLQVLANDVDPFNSELARSVYAKTKMEGVAYGTPLYVYNGQQEFWIPAIMAIDLYHEQCGLGTPSILRLPFGEHAIAAFTGFPEAMTWLDQRLQGIPAPSEC